MNLDSCTPDQRDSVKRVNGPLLVSAGAGSGKTFTLTQRIAYALLPESGPAANSIDEVLAITFTEKAAAEIKARVKRTLRAEGMAEEALKVDAAWISTIHGMCARILKTHALELGIDPAFGIAGDAERADLVAASIDEAIGADNGIISRGSYAALFDEYPARSTMPSVASVSSMLEALMDKAVGLRGGLDAIDFGPPPAGASSLARELLMAYEEVSVALEQAGGSDAAERARKQAADAIEALRAFLNCTHGKDELDALAKTVEGCVRIGGNFKACVKPEVKAYQAVHARVCRELVLGLAWPRVDELLRLARDAASRYEQKKRAACKLDNDDLLVKTLAAFEEHPEIAQRYENRFKLVMVDEFQDTSQLQIDMISRLSGERCAHLCTVGDAQQSIYRFRGADVNVYEAHKQTMRSKEVNAKYVELKKNFRSHADVLSFVDRVFEQPHVFGDAFMSLAPNETRPSSYRGRGPRIDLVLAMQPPGQNTGVSIDDAKRTCARAIAQRFAALRECGHAPRDMVVLLGKMVRAESYAQALRDEGFECAVTGGSLFADAPEVRVISRFVEALANPANTAALFEVLTSDMVRLSADDLLELATETDAETGAMRRRDLDRGFARLADCTGELSPRLAYAVDLFAHAQQEARTHSVAHVVQDVVVRSGWMARLQQQGAVGLACAANVLKAVRVIERIEADRPRGLASTARAFAGELGAGMKEAPGALSGSDGNVVKIMTIHASKGLEFPIVALADFDGARMSSGKLLVETCGEVARASLAAGSSVEKCPQVVKRAGEKIDGEDAGEDSSLASARLVLNGEIGAVDARGTAACSQEAYRAALRERAENEDLAEARRKLYVGLTRASEALVVAMDGKTPSSGNPASYTPLVDDIRSALCGLEDFPEEEAFLEYGGSAPARFERVLVQAQDAFAGDDAAEGLADDAAQTSGMREESDALSAKDAVCESEGFPLRSAEQVLCERERFTVPVMDGFDPVPRHPWNALRGDVFSYSSIAPDHGEGNSSRASKKEDQGNSRGVFDAFEAFAGDAPLDSLDLGADALRASADADKATGLGSAFHRAAQFAVETGTTPNAAHREALARALELSPAQRERFLAACERWFSSSTYAETLTWPLRRAEVPFFVPLAGESMEGEIDLLCTNGKEVPCGPALVIDYKTGGTDDEGPAALHEKHLLQAQCYAFALLAQGFEQVELQFVRVERKSAEDGSEPQIVFYRFNADDAGSLATIIASARSAARSR